MPHKSKGDAGVSHAPSSGPCGGATCLPTHSSCSKICPGCDTLPCDCPPVDGHAACWPGSGLHNTPDHGCNCFAQLGFCNGTKPEYKPGVECPSCWPEDNHACDCFASLGFCGPGTDGPPFGIAGDFDSFVLARFWDPPAARHAHPRRQRPPAHRRRPRQRGQHRATRQTQCTPNPRLTGIDI